MRVVRLGHRNDLEAEVLDGLRPGEAVILHPPDDLEDQARVTALPRAADPGPSDGTVTQP